MNGKAGMFIPVKGSATGAARERKGSATMTDAYETSGTSPTEPVLLSTWLCPPGSLPRKASNYDLAKTALRGLIPFAHSTCSGGWEQNRYSDGRWTFVVKSYSTVVAAFTPAQRIGDTFYGPDEWVTDEHYSTTTSKHRSYVAGSWAIANLREREELAYVGATFEAERADDAEVEHVQFGGAA